LLRGQALRDAETWAKGKRLSKEDERFLDDSQDVEKLDMESPHFSQRKRMECLKALPSIDLNPILAQLPQRQCVVRM
jgi:hypothetical protein